MPYKDREKQLEAQRQHYRDNKETYRGYHKATRMRARAFIDVYKEGKACTECGQDHPATICFHHPDPTQKKGDLHKMMRNAWTPERIKEELDKCIPLCHNCHAILHWKDKAGWNG